MIMNTHNFKAKFKRKLENNKAVFSTSMKIIIDNDSVIRNANNEIVPIENLVENEHYNVEVSKGDLARAVVVDAIEI